MELNIGKDPDRCLITVAVDKADLFEVMKILLDEGPVQICGIEEAPPPYSVLKSNLFCVGLSCANPNDGRAKLWPGLHSQRAASWLQRGAPIASVHRAKVKR